MCGILVATGTKGLKEIKNILKLCQKETKRSYLNELQWHMVINRLNFILMFNVIIDDFELSLTIYCIYNLHFPT